MTTHLIATRNERLAARLELRKDEKELTRRSDEVARPRQTLPWVAPAFGVSDWLCFAAAPTFAVMALLTGVLGGGQMAMCSTAADASPLSGMAVMYVLMSAFHSTPWLKLIFRRRSVVCGPSS